jgi:four helix bundle protein
MDNKNAAGYKKLIVWQKADELAKKIYKITNKFPSNELYGIISQLKRASLSVPLNIVEGYARASKNEFRQFLKIALGSLAETGYLLEFSYEQGFLLNKDFEELMMLRDQCGQLLWKLLKSQSS